MYGVLVIWSASGRREGQDTVTDLRTHRHGHGQWGGHGASNDLPNRSQWSSRCQPSTPPSLQALSLPPPLPLLAASASLRHPRRQAPPHSDDVATRSRLAHRDSPRLAHLDSPRLAHLDSHTSTRRDLWRGASHRGAHPRLPPDTARVALASFDAHRWWWWFGGDGGGYLVVVAAAAAASATAAL